VFVAAPTASTTCYDKPLVRVLKFAKDFVRFVIDDDGTKGKANLTRFARLAVAILT
jgi:hypothetical protein